MLHSLYRLASFFVVDLYASQPILKAQRSTWYTSGWLKILS